MYYGTLEYTHKTGQGIVKGDTGPFRKIPLSLVLANPRYLHNAIKLTRSFILYYGGKIENHITWRLE